MPQTFIKLNDNNSKPSIHIAPANGFPVETYIPMFKPLIKNHQVFSLPPRALWGDEPIPTSRHGWRMVTDDLLKGIHQHDLRNVILVGHSFGGVASMLATIDEPERFKGLILLDPTILPSHALEFMEKAIADGSVYEGILAQGAKRRRREFDSREEAYERFNGRSLFTDWPEETLRLYIEHGLRFTPNGCVTLTWTPEWEEYYYCTMYTQIWDDIPKLKGLLPTLFIRGETSNTYFESVEDQIKGILPDAQFALVEGHGHLFPQSAPEVTGKIVSEWIAEHIH